MRTYEILEKDKNKKSTNDLEEKNQVMFKTNRTIIHMTLIR